MGCGHVGLVTGGCLAAIGHQVVCVDRDAELIRLLQEGRLPLFEPHLNELFLRTAAAGALTFTTDTARLSSLARLKHHSPLLPQRSYCHPRRKVARLVLGKVHSYPAARKELGAVL